MSTCSIYFGAEIKALLLSLLRPHNICFRAEIKELPMSPHNICVRSESSKLSFCW